GGNNLAAAGALAIHQADHREVEQAAVVLAVHRIFATDARPDGDDQAVVDEQVGDVAGHVEQTTWIETQVEDEALEPCLGEGLHHLFHVLVRVPLKLGEANVADLVFRIDVEVPLAVVLALDTEYRLDGYPGPNQLEIERHRCAFPLDGQLDLGAFLA